MQCIITSSDKCKGKRYVCVARLSLILRITPCGMPTATVAANVLCSVILRSTPYSITAPNVPNLQRKTKKCVFLQKKRHNQSAVKRIYLRLPRSFPTGSLNFLATFKLKNVCGMPICRDVAQWYLSLLYITIVLIPDCSSSKYRL